MYFQLVDNQVLSTQSQPDVFNLHRLTGEADRRRGPVRDGREPDGEAQVGEELKEVELPVDKVLK